MSIAESLLPEFDQEMAGTRRVLERLPEDKWDWRAHPKSNTIGWNANHLAEIPGWGVMVMTQSSFDLHPVGGQRYQTPQYASRQEVVEFFDANVAAARDAIESIRDEQMGEPWSLMENGETLLTLPRGAMMRSFVLNHIIHHRAILCVYLRLNDIPVPALYGPSADERQ